MFRLLLLLTLVLQDYVLPKPVEIPRNPSSSRRKDPLRYERPIKTDKDGNQYYVDPLDDLIEMGSRIMGGTVVKIQDYPFLVTIIGGVFCGGTLIASAWVITAAHCIDPITLDSSQKVKVRGGFNSTKDLVQERMSINLYTHTKFDMDNLDSGDDIRYDIGLIKVDPPFKLTKVVNVIKVATPGVAKFCRLGKVCGIGAEAYSSNPVQMSYETLITRPLRCVDLHMATGETCMRTFRSAEFVKDAVLFTMEEKGMKDACQGDSGGPLICQNQLIGIISSGAPCGTPRACASYSNIEYYLDFIGSLVYGTKKKNEDTARNQTGKGAGKGRGVVHASIWQLYCIPLIFVSFFN